jgi:tripartite-type tricarboxylate transporter receptor subunit TctC
MGGQIPMTAQTAPAVLPAIQSGSVRALAVTSLKRISQLPDVPSIAEAVMPGFEVNSWYGLCAPAGTPTPILDKVHADLTTVLRTSDIQQRFNDMVLQVAPMSRDEFAKFIRTEAARWARVIKAAGIPQQ